ncbi:hypothetical protein QUA40_06035 [Microcoleus sp. Pol11C3]|uniref:hypothetical protein n=1 Tax=Microcoleus sp. Pol11C3 TaxID=3055390 RepID=UPI002FD706B1
MMSIRDLAIAKLQLPESFLPEVSDFLYFVMHKEQNIIAQPKLPDDIAKAWAKGFEEFDRLEVMTNGPIANLSYTKSYSSSSNSTAGRDFTVGK